MGSPKGTTNNAAHAANLTPFNSESAKKAAAKSVESRRRKREAERVAQAVVNRSIEEWVDTYEREQLAPACAAAAQKVAHMILSGEISDQRALVQALPVLVDIARIEEGLHTSATMHATLTMDDDARARLMALRAQAEPRALDTAAQEPGVAGSTNTPR